MAERLKLTPMNALGFVVVKVGDIKISGLSRL
jgi:hypothetical protein